MPSAVGIAVATGAKLMKISQPMKSLIIQLLHSHLILLRNLFNLLHYYVSLFYFFTIVRFDSNQL